PASRKRCDRRNDRAHPEVVGNGARPSRRLNWCAPTRSWNLSVCPIQTLKPAEAALRNTGRLRRTAEFIPLRARAGGGLKPALPATPTTGGCMGWAPRRREFPLLALRGEGRAAPGRRFSRTSLANSVTGKAQRRRTILPLPGRGTCLAPRPRIRQERGIYPAGTPARQIRAWKFQDPVANQCSC